MKITIDISNNEKEEKEVDETLFGKIGEGIARVGLASFIGAELNHIRPPRRNIGWIANWVTAFAVTDLIVEYGFKHKKFMAKDPEVVAEATVEDCEKNCTEETKEDDLK